MRQIATLPNEAARKLADYLLTLHIETQLLPEDDGMGLWVCDEDRVGQARQELETFQRNPSDPRYRQASARAHVLRVKEEQTEQKYREQQQAAEQLTEAGAGGARTVTLLVVVLSILVTIVTQRGKPDVVLTEKVLLSSVRDWPRLTQLASGEVWRLVTPIFLHLDWFHLIFDVLWFLSLARPIEALRGSGRLLLLVLVLAVLSNLTQYYLGRATFEGMRLVLRPTGPFGGLSGVVYGLFGYTWVKSRLQPEMGLQMQSSTKVLLMGWFFLCLFFLEGVANGAHAGGLVAGLIIGAISTRRRR